MNKGLAIVIPDPRAAFPASMHHRMLRNRPRSRAHRTLVSLVLALLAASCASTRLPSAMPPDSGRSRYGDEVPSWVGEPLSWAHLGAVETWLADRGPTASPFWRLEAELELARGRLEFALRDQRQGALDERGLRARLALAEQGFERVEKDHRATPAQKERATLGLRTAQSARGAPSEPALQHGLSVVTRQQWGARAALPARLTRATGRWTRITLHHSAEASAAPHDGSLGDSRDTLQRIQRHALESRDFGDIGYHFVIDPAGRVFEGRSLAWQGAHSTGENNFQNIGVCLLGNFEHEVPTPQALEALRRTLDHLRRVYSIPRSGVLAHQDLKSTLCPGRNLARWLTGTYR